jgi:hypothetical protein
MVLVEAVWHRAGAHIINFHLIFCFTFALSWGITLMAALVGSNVEVYADA